MLQDALPAESSPAMGKHQVVCSYLNFRACLLQIILRRLYIAIQV